MGQMISIVQVKNKGACAEAGRKRGINENGYVVRWFNRSSPPTTGRDRDLHPRAAYSALSTLAASSGLVRLLEVRSCLFMSHEGIPPHGTLAPCVANTTVILKGTVQ